MILPKLSKRFLSIVTSCAVVISPILSMYGIGLSTITLLDTVLFVLGILIIYLNIKDGCFVIKTFWRELTHNVLLIVIIYIALNLLIHLFDYNFSELYRILLRTARLMFYIIFVIIIKDDYFDINVAIKTFKFIAVLATCYLFLQYALLMFFDYSLRGYTLLFPLMRPELESFTSNLHFSLWARPRSIFAEPSQFGIYVSGYLALSLFWKLKDRFILHIFLSLGLVMSSSTTAILVMVVIWIIKLILIIKDNKKMTIKILSLFTLTFIVSLLVFSQTYKFDLFIGRLLTSFYNRIGGFEDYLNILSHNPSIKFLLFGYGMNLDKLTSWSSGLIKIPFYFGLVGLFVFISLIVYGIKKLRLENKLYLLYIFIIGIFSELWVSNWLVLFLPFIFYQKSIIELQNTSKKLTLKFSNDIGGD